MTVKLVALNAETVVKDERAATSTYAKFMVEPLESGYGHTMGNSLRRVLLSSLEGASISAIKIAGAFHEFCAVPGVVEDVTDIILNLKKCCSKCIAACRARSASKSRGRAKLPLPILKQTSSWKS